MLRDTSVERRRRADVGLRREVGAPRAARCGGGCWKAGKGLGPAAGIPGACRPADPLDVEGILALRSINERCAGRIEDAARILEAQNEILYAEERGNDLVNAED